LSAYYNVAELKTHLIKTVVHMQSSFVVRENSLAKSNM